MNGSNMENEKTPLYVAFSTQKGGVGKTTFTVLAASYLYYLKGYDVAVVDCDYPQHSIAGMRKRDAEQVGADEDYKRMAYEQFTRLGKKAYPVLCSSPEKAIATADEHIATGHVPDIVFFDLPGTVNSEGVINSLAGMDYIFTPISADKVVLESSLSFAMAIQKLLVKNEACRLAGLYLFWNMVDGREKTDLYTAYDKTIKELELPLMKTFIPDTKRYKKELVADKKAVFRSTLFPASRPLVRGSNLEGKYSINSLVYWVTYVHNVVYSFYRSMIYCYINSTQRCAGSIVIDIIPTNGADKRKFFPFAPYFPVTNVIKRYFYPYFPAIIGIKGYSFPYFPYLSGIMKIKTALYSLFSRLDWHKTVVFPCLGEIYEGIRSLSWEIPVT